MGIVIGIDMKKKRQVVNIDGEVAERVKEKYPGLSWTEILRLLLEPTSPINIDTSYATKEELKELKDKFEKVLSNLIKTNGLKK